jgi:hypothetical protein
VAEESAGKKLTAFELWKNHGLKLVPAPADRAWMDETAHRNAYHCLPMLMANASGWLLLNNREVRARWNGGTEAASVEFEYRNLGMRATVAQHNAIMKARAAGAGAQQGAPSFPSSAFGNGVITWVLPYLFRTPPDYNLLVRGPANWFEVVNSVG